MSAKTTTERNSIKLTSAEIAKNWGIWLEIEPAVRQFARYKWFCEDKRSEIVDMGCELFVSKNIIYDGKHRGQQIRFAKMKLVEAARNLQSKAVSNGFWSQKEAEEGDEEKVQRSFVSLDDHELFAHAGIDGKNCVGVGFDRGQEELMDKAEEMIMSLGSYRLKTVWQMVMVDRCDIAEVAEELGMRTEDLVLELRSIGEKILHTKIRSTSVEKREKRAVRKAAEQGDVQFSLFEVADGYALAGGVA